MGVWNGRECATGKPHPIQPSLFVVHENDVVLFASQTLTFPGSRTTHLSTSSKRTRTRNTWTRTIRTRPSSSPTRLNCVELSRTQTPELCRPVPDVTSHPVDDQRMFARRLRLSRTRPLADRGISFVIQRLTMIIHTLTHPEGMNGVERSHASLLRIVESLHFNVACRACPIKVTNFTITQV